MRARFGANVIGMERWRKFRRVMVSVTGVTEFQAKDVLLSLIDLSRNSIHRTPHYLGAYIQSLTLYALNSNDIYHIANLQKQVNSALSRIRATEVTLRKL